MTSNQTPASTSDARKRLAEKTQPASTLESRLHGLHQPVEIEPSDTICGECSWRLPNGRWSGKVVEYPCPTLLAIDPEVSR